jgi:thiamine pyrophosphate-dependent acetolactate synthase large subunit-like protein
MLTGGAIGEVPGAAMGAAITCPDRKVINFHVSTG